MNVHLFCRKCNRTTVHEVVSTGDVIEHWSIGEDCVNYKCAQCGMTFSGRSCLKISGDKAEVPEPLKWWE